jgi:uncharacterized protein
VTELRKLWIEGPAGRLECALRVACPARAAAVLAHPHPQYGGTLHNPVIYHADRRLHEAGFTTLRFNFRGVGSSEGVYDEGRGEVLDLAAAASWLRGIAVGLPLFAVGYSFGSWCAIRHAADDRSIAAVVAIGLPVREYRFAEIARLRHPLAAVQGSEDEFGAPEEVRAVLAKANPPGDLIVVPGATHLFPGRVPEAAAAVREAAERCLLRIPGGNS